MNDYSKIKKQNKTKTCLKLLSSFKLKGRESELCTQNYWSEALLTLNLQSTRKGRFSCFICLPPDWQWRQSHFHSSWYFRAFSRGRSEDCSMSLSLRKMSGILMEIYLLLSPEAVFASNMPQCCFCFLQASGEGGSDPTREWLYRALGREPKGTGLNPADPALAKPPGHRRGWSSFYPPWGVCGDEAHFIHAGGSWGWGSFYPPWVQHSPSTSSARPGKAGVMTVGFLVIESLEKPGPKAPLFAKQTKPDNFQAEAPSLQW